MNDMHRIAAVIFTVASSIFPSELRAQLPEEDYYQGRLWVLVEPSYSNKVPHNGREVSLGYVESLIGPKLASALKLTEVRKPFHQAKDPSVSEVFELRHASLLFEESLIKLLEKLPFVRYAERVPVMRPTFTPNDLGPENGTNNQWGLWRISAQAAWDITQGSAVVNVAVVDDAVLVNHPDLIPNLLPGYDVADDDTDPMPNNNEMSHGTHVAGIIGAATNNGTGVASIGFGIKLLPVKSSNQAQVVTDGYAGVVWAADNGADVINMSWGGSGFSQTGQNIMNYSYNAGCINVAAAGNDNVSDVFYPAGYNNVISVASTNQSDAKSSFSNFGSWVQVSAPGSEIRSTYFNSSLTGTYANLSGTSMASPMVAGLAGLVLSVNPQMSQAQVTACILTTADDISAFNSGFQGQLGSGRINAEAAVLCALATVNAPPTPIVQAMNTLVCPGEEVQFIGSSLGGTATSYSWSFPGGNPGTSIEQNPVVTYGGLGQYPVTLTAFNQFGGSSTTISAFIDVSTEAMEVFYFEDFEGIGNLEQLGFQISNPDNGITWETAIVSGSTSGVKAALVNLFNYSSNGQRDGLVTPVIDCTGHNNLTLDFVHAHRRRSASFADSLIIYVSTNGGQTFPFKVFGAAENGQGSFATNSILNQDFIPANGNDWCFGGDIGSGCFTVDLSAFDGLPSVRLKFETYNNTGNNIYVDDIQLSGSCYLPPVAPVAAFSSAQQETCAGGSIQFFDQSQNIPSSYAWEFEGGSPSTSDSPTPMVTYAQPGTYSVSLTASNAYGTDEIVQVGFVTVTDGFDFTVSDDFVDACENVPFQLIASGADTYSWSPAIGLSSTTDSEVTVTPAFDITYTVTGTVGTCVLQQTIEVLVSDGPSVPSVVSQNDLSFTLINPVGVQGHYPYTLPAAGWGSPDFSTVAIEAPLIIARDATVADSLLCQTAINAASIDGNIAVVYRGGCEFSAKALNAQNAGAVAVIVVNNVPDAPIQMAPGASGAQVTIPVFMVSQSVGEWLNAAINGQNAVARIGQFNGGSFEICPGDEVWLAGPGGQEQYLWTDGSTGGLMVATEPGSYAVSVFGSNGCPATSIAYEVSYFVGTQPVIQQNGNLLSAPNVPGIAHQWFLNGVPIPGATSSVLVITESGNYQVEVTHASGCILMSETFAGIYITVEETQSDNEIVLFPVPGYDWVHLQLPIGLRLSEIQIRDLEGRLVKRVQPNMEVQGILSVEVADLATGMYVFALQTTNGWTWIRFVKAD